MTIKFKKVKETKNTVKFEEVVAAGKPPVIGQLYVQKWAVLDKDEIEIDIKGIK